MDLLPLVPRLLLSLFTPRTIFIKRKERNGDRALRRRRALTRDGFGFRSVRRHLRALGVNADLPDRPCVPVPTPYVCSRWPMPVAFCFVQRPVLPSRAHDVMAPGFAVLAVPAVRWDAGFDVAI